MSVSVKEIQKALREGNRLPYAFTIEDGLLFASFYDFEKAAKLVGTAKAKAFVSASIVTDKGFLWEV